MCDPYLSACARNIWYVAALHDIDLCYVHIPAIENNDAVLLSRWTGSTRDWASLHSRIPEPVWLHITQDFPEL